MPELGYERLTQLDNSFLVYEDTMPGVAMHVASTQIHDAQSLRASDGSIDIDRIEEFVASRLHRIPRYRQILARTPIEGHPVWVDDPNFNIRYHVRHSRLPRPGDERQLKRMVGRIFSQRLDREKPLWELWIIEGLEGDRLAIMSKVHHCMIDGVSGSELIATMLSPEPTDKPGPIEQWNPRPIPSSLELGVGEMTRVARAPLDAGAAMLRLVRNQDRARELASDRMRGLASLLADSGGTTPVPFNQTVGPHRRIDWMPMSLDQIKAVRKAVGGTVNDVVLATAAGALARYLARERGIDLRPLRFRAMTPVNMRREGEGGNVGNRVSAWTIDLPIAEPDPLARLEFVSQRTREYKSAGTALGAELITQASEWTGSGVLSLGARFAMQSTPFNVVVTNVPGPQIPLYLLDAPLREIHPHVPLMGKLGLGIALFSYAGTLSWGFAADWDLIPDLHQLVLATQESFSELLDAAGVT